LKFHTASTGESANRRRGVLRVLRLSLDPMSVAAIADVLGVHPNSVPLLFRAVRQMDRAGTRHYRFELAENATGVVCPVHLGLMQGAMDTWRAPVLVDRLEAFVEPDLCLAHLTLQGAVK
jgi:predicted ArsR family transcriptional regulator